MEALNWEQSITEGQGALQRLFEVVKTTAGKVEAHEAEKTIFRMIQVIGLAAMKGYFAERGTGDVGPAIELADGKVLELESRLRPTTYFSVFGKIAVPRSCYRTPGEEGVFPLDGQVNLPSRSYSYLLQQWMTLFDAEHPFADGSDLFADLLGLDIAESVLIDVGQEATQDYDAFYEQRDPPASEDEGEIQVVSFDGKGVPMIKREAAKIVAKLNKGEKRQTTKEALVGVGYTADRKERTPEELAQALVFPEEARKRREAEGVDDPAPRAQNVRRIASLTRTKAEVMEVIRQDADRRDPLHRRPLAVLLDGALGLWNLATKQFKDWPGAVFILDILHVLGYLWLAANTLHKEGSVEGKMWVLAKVTEILHGRVGYVIGGLRQILAKRKRTLKKSQKEALEKVVKFLRNHRRWMRYDEYLAAGLPVATGVVESACNSFKHRMEGQGKRWSIPGAEAVLTLRSLRKSHDDDLAMYWRFRAYQERFRNYGKQPRFRPVADLEEAA